ncbi:rhamnogalacturonan acetylesterase [Arenimonas daejeonensis]|uniref:rhamnogalacturonan acetylesterase n=1 Tax=Arenimonas daejeonensis TaxID=370777 RepID=UPI0011BF443A|nr:rhamnogalacturonan acetylesterase [Arenimonas daejeonensis]
MFATCLGLMLALAAPEAPPVAAAVTVHLAGDSTMAPKLDVKRPESGWGEYLQAQFRPGTVVVDNRARNGRSTRTFIELGEWQALLEVLAPGDVVLIQFAHNDQSENKPDRYTPLPDYVANLERFLREVRAREATPMLLTPVARRNFDATGRLVPSHGGYPQRVRELAAREQVALVDMERLSSDVVTAAGVEGSKALFLWQAPGQHPNYPQGIEDDTHFSPEGARRMAAAFADELRRQSLPLADRLP